MHRPDMNTHLHRSASRLALAAALLLGAAPATLAGDGAPGSLVGPPPGAKRGGDGVGGIEKTGGSGPTGPTTPNNGGPLGNPVPVVVDTTALAGWTDAGGALPGEHAPALEGSGGEAAGQSIALVLREAAATVPATLVAGTSASLQAFKGGTLVPSPDLLITGLLTDTGGGLHLQAALPPNLPPGLQLWVQLWVPDAGAPEGLAASNALCLLVP